MKRRTFIKALAAALLAPFIPGALDVSAKKAIPDPGPGSHLDDSLRYLTMYEDRIIIDQRRRRRSKLFTRQISPDLSREIDKYWYEGSQWTKRQQAQMKLNRSRSLAFNRIKLKL